MFPVSAAISSLSPVIGSTCSAVANSHSLADTVFFTLVHPRFAVEISIMSVIVSVSVSPARLISGCRSLIQWLGNTSSNLAVVENQVLP